MLSVRGFFPRGGGEVNITVPHIASLSPVTLLERGEVTNVMIETFTAGAVRDKVGKFCVRERDEGRESLIRMKSIKLFF